MEVRTKRKKTDGRPETTNMEKITAQSNLFKENNNMQSATLFPTPGIKHTFFFASL